MKETELTRPELLKLLEKERQRVIRMLERRGDMSGGEIARYVDALFPWDLRGLKVVVTIPREDCYAVSTEERSLKAENRQDAAYIWLCLRIGGACEEILSKYCEKCIDLDYEQAMLWITLNGLMDVFLTGDANVRTNDLLNQKLVD